MKPGIGLAMVLGCLMATGPVLRAQASNEGKIPDANQSNGSGQGNSQNKPDANSQSAPAQAPPRVKSQSNQNPFPEDTSSVPVMPSRENPGVWEPRFAGLPSGCCRF